MKLMETVLRLSLASTMAAGLIGTLVAVTVGPSLAMALAILGGKTEPITPAAVYPWWAAGCALAVCGVGLWVEYRRARWVGVVVAHVGAVVFVLLPFVHLLVLWRRT